MFEDVAEVIDVDAEVDDDSITFVGFTRNVMKSRHHVGLLDQDGIVYAGFRNGENPQKEMQARLRNQRNNVISLLDEEEQSDPIPGPSAIPVGNKQSRTSRSPAATRLPVVFTIEDSSDDEPIPQRQYRATITPPVMDISDVQPSRDSSPKPGLEMVDVQDVHLSSTDCEEVDNGTISDAEIEEGADNLFQRIETMSLSRFTHQQPQMPLWDVRSQVLYGLDIPAVRTHAGDRLHIWSMLQPSWTGESILKHSGVVHGPWKKYYGLKSAALDKKAPGAVNHIAQSNGIIAIASAVADGASEDDYDVSHYNCEGSLMIWNRGEGKIMHGHERVTPGHGASLLRHYTVNDVKFDPTCPTTLVSSGYDRRVHTWNLDVLEDSVNPKLDGTVSYDCVPCTISFKPGESLLAVAGSNGHVYLQTKSRALIDWSIANTLHHTTTGMAWGTAQSSHMLIASTHASDDSGVHRMFDVNHGSSIVKFDASEAGQKLAVDDTGGQLAIAVEGPSNCCSLRFYDIQHRNKHTIHKVALEPFSSRPGAPSEFEDSREINDVVFSQDSLYLAVARGDNTLHIYDTRKLGSGPIDVFEHNAEVSVGDTYGVVQAQWVEGTHQERGILSGGADGCVRLWDVRKAAGDSRNGEVVAQCSDDIGCFSLGNTSQNEWPLVVGECSGKVTIFGGAVHG